MAKSAGKPGRSGSKATMGAATDKLAELAANPLARSMLAAGLVAAAAALTTNQKVRQGAKKASREALDGVDAAADNASKIGAAIVTAATDAVRRMMSTAGRSGAPAAAKPAPKAKASKKAPAAKSAAAKSASAPVQVRSAKPAAKKSAVKKPASKAKKAPSKARKGAAKPAAPVTRLAAAAPATTVKRGPGRPRKNPPAA